MTSIPAYPVRAKTIIHWNCPVPIQQQQKSVFQRDHKHRPYEVKSFIQISVKFSTDIYGATGKSIQITMLSITSLFCVNTDARPYVEYSSSLCSNPKGEWDENWRRTPSEAMSTSDQRSSRRTKTRETGHKKPSLWPAPYPQYTHTYTSTTLSGVKFATRNLWKLCSWAPWLGQMDLNWLNAFGNSLAIYTVDQSWKFLSSLCCNIIKQIFPNLPNSLSTLLNLWVCLCHLTWSHS